MANLDLAGIITRVCTDLRAKLSKVTVKQHITGGTKSATVTVDGVEYALYAPTPPKASTTAPLMDGTASYGSGTNYARSNHRHPTDTSRQETLVSGTNIKTINGDSILGSGDLTISGTAVETLYDQSGWTVMRCGNIVIVHVHGASCSGSTATACSYVIPAAYRPAYNASNLIASTGTGVFSRLYVNASTGAISTASVGTTSTNTWYGTLVYAYAS